MPPSLDVIFAVQPDCREVERVGEAFQLALLPHDLHHQVDAETARYIAEQVLPLAPSERRAALDALLGPVVAAAVEACRQADRVGQRATVAQERLLAVLTEGGSWLAPLEEQADAATQQAAELLILAHQRCQEARGVSRAVGFARRGEPWVPFTVQAATEALLEDERRSRARRATHAG